MKEAIKVLEEKRNIIESVLTPFNKEHNSEAYKKSLKELEGIKLAIWCIEIVEDNGSPNEHGLWLYNKYKYMKK